MIAALPMTVAAQQAGLTASSPSPCANIAVSLAYGSSDTVSNGGGVSLLQMFLYKKGYLAVSPTGYFGRLTLAAVKNFQTSNGIISTGYVGPITRASIKNIDCVAQHAIPVSTPASSGGVTTIPPAPVAPASAPSTPSEETLVPVGPITVASSTVNVSPAPQYVVGGSTFPVAIYGFTAPVGGSIISEMDFTATNNTIVSIAAGGVTAPMVNGAAVLSNLHIVIPSGYAGINVPVSATYNTVGQNGLPTGQSSVLTLTLAKSAANTLNVSIPSNTMTLVASKPAVLIADPGSSVSLNGQTELLDVTVSASPAGDINIDQLPISVTANGGVSIPNQALVVKDATNEIISNVSGTLSVSANGNGTANLVFANGYRIPAGASQTFKIFASPVNYSGSAGTLSIGTALGPASSFLWTDIAGNSGEGMLTGQAIVNWPTSVHSATN